ncbi:hypothetical protein [Kamptonema sp. UHCC 0994]|uniref:hypothetical protein n=1 Tax=Kamptonema sp. UHCC 0994 TaxID=3031329 RepID=UPI0023B9F89D|nr:hypothetical protein [Kamptonema sp. UHCC 0994]MDF0552489.1 hypothetical protein [Kamptonema sp. UHCC 0994]
MIDLNKTWIIVKPEIIKLIKSYHLLILLGAGIIIVTQFYGWDKESLTIFNIPLEGYHGSRETVYKNLLHEWFSWAWIYITFYVLLRLLLPLGDSFSVSQLLWLRLTPCSPWEIAAARAIWVIAYGVWLGFLGLIWVLVTSLYHHIYPANVLLDVLGLVSYIIFVGGMIAVLDFDPECDYFSKRVIVFFALFLPSLLDLLKIGIGGLFHSQYIRFFPYTHPFAMLTSENLYHFGVAGILGLFFLSFHILSKLKYSSVEISELLPNESTRS